MNELYTLQVDGQARDGFIITKYDSIGLEIESQYKVSEEACSCPAGHRPSCRHRKMLPLLIPRCDSEWFLNYDETQWLRFEDGKLVGEKREAKSMPRPAAPVEGEGPAPQVPLIPLHTGGGPKHEKSWRRM